MKKIFLLLSLVVMIAANARAEENVSAEMDASQKVEQEVEKYKKECSEKRIRMTTRIMFMRSQMTL